MGRNNVNGATNSTVSILNERFDASDLKECRKGNGILSDLIRELLMQRRREGKAGKFAECKTINEMLLKHYDIKEDYDTSIGWFNREYRIKPFENPFFGLTKYKSSLPSDPYDTRVISMIDSRKLFKIFYYLESQVIKADDNLKNPLKDIYNSHAPSVGENGLLNYKKKSGKIKQEKGLPRNY